MDKDIQGKHGRETIKAIPPEGFGIMDRGFSSIEKIQELLGEKNRYFVLKIKKNLSLSRIGAGLCRLGKDPSVEVRVVAFCDWEAEKNIV